MVVSNVEFNLGRAEVRRNFTLLRTILQSNQVKRTPQDYSNELIITRASVYGKPKSENTTDFLAKREVMVPGVPCVDRGISRLIRSSRIQRCRSFSERVGPRVIFLKVSQVSSCSKGSREITLTESIAVKTKIESQ